MRESACVCALEWGQDEVKRMSNETGARVELFLIPDVGHTVSE